mgnify:CR=1 FL=1
MVVRVGLIGTGTVAQMMPLPILNDLSGMYQITAVSDVSPSVLKAISEKYHAKAYTSPLDLCKAEDVDAVFVLSSITQSTQRQQSRLASMCLLRSRYACARRSWKS